MRCLLQALTGEAELSNVMFPFRPVLLISLILVIMACASCSPQQTKTIVPVTPPGLSSCGTLPS